jgi:hypothetical protein
MRYACILRSGVANSARLHRVRRRTAELRAYVTATSEMRAREHDRSGPMAIFVDEHFSMPKQFGCVLHFINEHWRRVRAREQLAKARNDGCARDGNDRECTVRES